MAIVQEVVSTRPPEEAEVEDEAVPRNTPAAPPLKCTDAASYFREELSCEV